MTPDSAMMERECPLGCGERDEDCAETCAPPLLPVVEMPIIWSGIGEVGRYRIHGADGRVHIQDHHLAPALCGQKGGGVFAIRYGSLDDTLAARNRRIKAAHETGTTAAALADMYGLAVSTIRRIAKAPYAADEDDGLTDDERVALERQRAERLARAPEWVAIADEMGVLCEACGSAWTGMRAC